MQLLSKGSMFITVGLGILNTSLGSKNNSILVQGGDVIAKDTEVQDGLWVQHVGFASRPAAADPGKSAAEMVRMQDIDTQRDYIIGSRDIRSQAILSDLGYGESYMYASGQTALKLKNNGTLTLGTTTDNSSSGQGLNLSITGADLSLNTPWNNIKIDKTNVTIGNTTIAQTVAFSNPVNADMNVLSALISALSAYVTAIQSVAEPGPPAAAKNTNLVISACATAISTITAQAALMASIQTKVS